MTMLLYVVLLQLLSHALAQLNEQPIFDNSEITVSIYEDHNTSLPVLANNLAASDPEDDMIVYSIPMNALGSDKFDLVNYATGFNIFFVATETLDRESVDQYTVVVRADDGMNHGNADDVDIIITVELDDVNDNMPVVTNLPMTKAVDENTNLLTILYDVDSTDDDIGKNGQIRYSIESVVPSSGTDKFGIYVSSGQIFLKDDLDYEDVIEYVITVRAEDRGDVPLFSYGEFTLQLLDVNDQDPIFSQNSYTAQIYENLEVNSFVLEVHAVDQDIMIDDEILYSIDNTSPGASLFAINESTGIVYVNGVLDVDGPGSPKNYSLTIIGEELMDPTKLTTTTAIIVILDINDNPPMFEEATYNGTLAESSLLGTTVVTVTAIDVDEGVNAQFTFHLMNLLSTPLPFNVSQSLDGESGHIQSSGDLDFETISQYKFEVIATEVVGNKTKTASTVVTVDVTNINDNFPVFNKNEYFAEISENANIGDVVGKVTAEDKDIGSFGTVYYYLINHMDVFEINEINGIVTLKQKIDYEIIESYALTVAANDSALPPSPQLKAQVQIHVQVLDANDNGPVISVNGSQAITQVDKQLEEEQEAGVLVFVIDADDADDTPNDLLEYFVEVLEPKGFTDIHFEYSVTESNQLITSVPLDHELVQQYKLRACVTDLGSLLNTPPGSGSGIGSGSKSYDSVNDLPQDHVDCIDIIVDVIDENDNNPVFVGGVSSYTYSVTEEQDNNTFVGYANATDSDSGSFGVVRYSLSGVDHENFTIDSETGLITTTGPIDREMKNRFDLIVTAQDLDPIVPLSSTASLTITILDLNDNAPVFSQPIYVENDIVENTISISIQVSASDKDIDENGDLTYVIIDGNINYQFVIDELTGEITRNSSVTLDREVTPEFQLTIEATDGGNPTKSANGTVFIEIQDDNDNSPLFEQTVYRLNITEGTLIGTQILTVVANDIDDGPNGVIRYSILMTGPDYQQFAIDQMSGILSTNKDFDFDTEKDTYSINIESLDSGVPPKSSQATVVVTILDINDNSPIFSKVQYSQSISEDVSGGASITTVKATDTDSGANREIEYAITEVIIIGTAIPTDDEADNTTDLFTLDEDTGELYISVGRSFDYESVTGYFVLVEARDGGVPSKTDSSVVQVTILDSNDNNPVLSEDSYFIVLTEDTEVPTIFNIFSYEDKDSGNNGIATYMIDNTIDFEIDANTGVLTLVSSLDYEIENYFEFDVTITDGGNPKRTDTAIVNVTITDVNDNSPIFQTPSLVTINLNESNYTSPSNMILYTFEATDIDDGLNGVVQYTITSGNTSLFDIDEGSGEFKVIGVIDRETKDYYELIITAEDAGGMFSLSASATINIHVLDINENPPSFIDTAYSNTISENNIVGMSLAQVEATDPDLGDNAKITYSISDMINFNITDDGVIIANTVYDYETVQSLSVLVTATDGGQLFTRVPFKLNITDKNDNAPEFINTFNTPFQLPENTSIGFFVASAKATDLDSGANGDVTYQLSGAQGKFSIDSNGNITLQSTLDRETNDYYSLIVTGFDHGSPQMTSINVINVTVNDVNDQMPVFEATFYSIEIPENESISTTLLSVSASDNDIDKNSELSFEIISGNIGNTFMISAVYDSVNNKYTAHIILDKAFDYETETSYSLQITAKDMGSPSQTSTAFISIKIVNVNDEVPIFSPSDSYSFSISEIAIFGTPIGTVYATDDDAGTFGKISSYSFSPGTSSNVLENFDLSPLTGVLTLSNTSNLDFDNGNKNYTFSIVATDGGDVSSIASIIVYVLGHNEDSPVFQKQSYTATVYENLPTGQSLITVIANDPDNSPVTYSIIEGNTNNNFEIDTSGIIKTTKELDREDIELYVLRIEASDGGSSPLFGFTQVEITVLDENDNFPVFPGLNVQYQLSEASINIIFTPVVAAIDIDKDNNSKITYTAEGEGIPDVFSVNTTNGEIRLIGTLNYELKNTYVFLIFAEDNGDIPKKNNITVTITVLDFNDNNPEFEMNVYTETISESIGAGAFVTAVFANDSDSGLNAMISYSINGSDKFEINSVGTILTITALDYETDTMYSLTVTATDKGTPVKSSTAIVELYITDANDNTPIFGQFPNPYEITEQDLSNELLLFSAAATDADGTSPNNNVTYNITNGNDDMFRIDEYGNLYAIENLDYESKQSFLLTIQAKDNPIDPSDTTYNTTQVSIIIKDANDNSPVWKDNQHRVTPNQFAGTIREDAEADQLVLFIEATDADSGSFGKVTYSFLTPSNKFYINETSGFVYTHGLLDAESVDFYNLTIVARDGELKSTIGYLGIEVIDVNDRQPSFISSFFYEEVSEAEEKGYLLVTLEAFDIDSDALEYSIMNGNSDGFFMINASSGEVSLAKDLDREAVDDFLLTVFVSDQEFNDTTNLRVVVNDVNDNAPLFIDAPYFAYILENTVSGAVLLYNMNDNTTRVQAVDADKPDTSNSIVVYEMIGANKDILNIGPSTGVLTVASGANLNYEVDQTIVVEVLAQDSATPPGAMSSSTTITITILDVNDNSPVFTKGSSYSASVTENQPIGTTVTMDIEATDVDTGVGGIVTFDIVNSVPSANLDDFVIDNSTGIVTLAAELDREETHEIILTIRATDGGPSTFMAAEASLIVTVLDMNDNEPIFNQSSYFQTVSEDIGIAYVTTVLATDEDDNNNGNVEYSLLSFDNVFLINADTGVISTVTSLDHETENLYFILVEACDKGLSILCSNVTVTIQVIDVNDLFPVFDYNVYYTTLCDDATPVTHVLQVIAFDGDSGDYGTVTYSLASGSSLGSDFTLNQDNGQISLVNNLQNNIAGSNLTVTIVATDGGSPGKTGETEVKILFCDRDVTPIYFNQSLYPGAILENQSPPVTVTTVSAISSSTPIIYSILPVVNNYFTVTSDGMINTTVKLDREERETYSLIVIAVDSAVPSNTAYSTISVTILDINDDPPMFLALPYEFSLIEESIGTTVISTIYATDPDKPFDPMGVTYSIDSASNPDGVFSIDANGTIYANQPVDRETISIYELKIKATDVDIDPRIATATVTVRILDINDNSPVFDQPNYATNVAENHPSNFYILKVSATDIDLDLNKEITYSIESGPGNNEFFIDSSTGVIRTISQLDYEQDTWYNITVKAQDKGMSPRSSFTNVIVTVEDYNDCTPMFTENKYEVTLMEDHSFEKILDIDATDCDSGVNKEITFSIVAGNGDDRFELNATTGELFLKNSLDFENVQSYILSIQATDGGIVSLSNLTQVVIGVVDVNDEDPVFQQNVYNVASLPEDRSVGFEVIVVTATDKDASVDNSALEYSIKSGNTNGDFEIDSNTGSIKIKKLLDRENISMYHIVIEAQDKGAIPRSANATLDITITDVNDNAPILLNLESVNVLENTTNTVVIYNVTASDKDINENALLQFSLQNYDDIFSINPGTGEIMLITMLDYDDSDREYQLSIEVTDLAFDVSARLTDNAILNILVEDINDNDPMFTKSQYTVSRSEEEAIGQLFVTLEASDNDGTTANNEITYTITNCTPGCLNKFSIDSVTGDITNEEKLDREDIDNYILTVMAANVGVYPERSDTATVTVTITDINDQSPQFNQNSYVANVFEGVASNTPLFTVDATDGDQPNTVNTELSYKIISVISNNPFSLNEDTGLLEVTGSIDRESVAFYNFTIRVEDNGATKLYHDVQAEITVEDQNDQPPVFVSNTQSVKVNEGITNSDLPYSLWTPSYTDSDELLDNKRSLYGIVSVTNGSNSLGVGSDLISIDQLTGEVSLVSLVDFEVTKNLTVSINVFNNKNGTGVLCGGFDKDCRISDIATLNIEITDFNDNIPEFDRSSYSGQISTSSDPGTQIRQIYATDKDSQSTFGIVRYRLTDGSSTKFRIQEETGWVVSRGTFENDNGRMFTIGIEAYDNLGQTPSLSSTIDMTILALSDFRRVLILFDREVTEFTEAKEKLIVDALQSLTGYTIVVEEIREHLLDDVGDVDSTKTDFIFHAINSNGEIVDFDILIENLNVEEFFNTIAACQPLKITSLQPDESYPKVETIMLYLIALCGIIVIGAIVVLVFACQQRYIALNSMWKSQMRDAFYGAADPSLVEGAMSRDFSGETFEMRRTTKSPLYVEPYENFGAIDSTTSVGDVDSVQQGNPLYEERELRMDMFELSDDETDGDLDDENLLAEALKDENSDNGSVTAI